MDDKIFAPGARRLRTGLVLGGGAARGAYEAGVFAWLREVLPKHMGGHVAIDVLAGSSVGAINACFIAGTNHEPATQGRRFLDTWRSLRLEEVLSFGVGDLWRVLRESMGRVPIKRGRGRHGGLVDSRGLEAVVGRVIPWLEIGRNIRDGNVQALAITATHVASGRTTVFLQRHGGPPRSWSRDPNVHAVSTRVGPKHALASAAIPVLFPAVTIAGELYLDGGLRHNVPISPALRLGAERVAVISLRARGPAPGATPMEPAVQEQRSASAPFLLGKALNALMLDHTDTDLSRLQNQNRMLEAGRQVFGGDYAARMNEVLEAERGHSLRWVRNILVRPSQPLGVIAGTYARSPEFRRSATGLAGKWLRKIAESEGRRDSELASYLLFDGGFCSILAELGYADAAAMEEEWVRFFSPEPASALEEEQLARRDRAAAG